MRRVRETISDAIGSCVAALFWFPWLYSAANNLLLLNRFARRFFNRGGAAMGFAGGFLRLWLGLIALGAIYYFPPKMNWQTALQWAAGGGLPFGRSSFFRELGWSGDVARGSGPPVWVPSVGVASILCLLVPVAGNALNWYLHIRVTSKCSKRMPPLASSFFGAACYVVIDWRNWP
jgi:hypothetical protein